MKILIFLFPRTYNASFTLQEQLDEMTDPDDNVSAKMLSYNRANRAVAVLCNHQVIREFVKTFTISNFMYCSGLFLKPTKSRWITFMAR